MALDPPSQLVFDAIRSGATAASCSFFERDGAPDHGLFVGDEAKATVRFTPSGHVGPQEQLVPLAGVLLLATQGVVIDEVSAPDSLSWTWTAAAAVVAERTLPAGLILPEPLRRRQLWVLEAHDDRGMSAAHYSENPSVSKWGPLGDVLTRQVSRTTIEGAARRRKRAGDALDPATEKAAIAGAVAEAFSTPAALSGSDGGQALLTLEITSFDPLSHRWKTIASFPRETNTSTQGRRAALSDVSLKALEAEVFGSGVRSPRSTRTVFSLDTPVGNDGQKEDPPTYGDTLRAADDPAQMVEQRLELTELAIRARLSPREREVLSLWAEDRAGADIADALGLAQGTVRTLQARIRQKMTEAAKEDSEIV